MIKIDRTIVVQDGYFGAEATLIGCLVIEDTIFLLVNRDQDNKSEKFMFTGVKTDYGWRYHDMVVGELFFDNEEDEEYVKNIVDDLYLNYPISNI